MKIRESILSLLLLSVLRTTAGTFDVNTLSDSGPGSLRQAILEANASPGDDAITFSVTGTITLSNALPTVTDALNIAGPGTNLLTISGNKKWCLFKLTGGYRDRK